MLSPEETILDALRAVKLTGSTTDIVTMGMVSGVALKGGKAAFLVTLDPRHVPEAARVQAACESAVKAVSGVESVTVVVTAQAPQSSPAPARKAVWNKEPVPHVGRIVAVASGKGGVGKSTTSVNLAHALVGLGARVGLLDADIYGPSIPRMMGLSGQPDVKGDKIIPLMAHGVACISMGLLVGEASAIVWRGPQMSKALHQMLRGVAWGSADAPLDILLIDMPPGTGDIHLSLVQQAPVDGAVIVTTPQDVAVADAAKCMDMFAKVNVPVVGVIENMSGFTDPASGVTHAIFGEGGGRRLAERGRVAFLGQVPIAIALREASDAGTRFSDDKGLYRSIAGQILWK